MLRPYISFLFVCIIFLGQAKEISLKQAIDDKLVSINISTHENSTHYHTPFIVTIKNNSSLKLNIALKNGTMLIPDKEEYQNFIITEDVYLVLDIGRTVKRKLKAMCLEQLDAAPNNVSNYSVSKSANENLCKLSKFVDKNKIFEPNAQFLMWEIADNKYNSDQLGEFELDKNGQVCVINFDENGNRVIAETVETYDPPKKELRVYGEFEMDLIREKNVHIAMFTMQNVLVKELYNNPTTPKGNTKMHYEFNSMEFEEEKYHIKLVVNGEVVLKRVVVMDV